MQFLPRKGGVYKRAKYEYDIPPEILEAAIEKEREREIETDGKVASGEGDVGAPLLVEK